MHLPRGILNNSNAVLHFSTIVSNAEARGRFSQLRPMPVYLYQSDSVSDQVQIARGLRDDDLQGMSHSIHAIWLKQGAYSDRNADRTAENRPAFI